MKPRRLLQRLVRTLLPLSCAMLPLTSTLAQLAPGDIAIVSMNADTTKTFAFVALVDIPGGEEIKFTDNGWMASGSFRAYEGVITWTAPVGGVAAGTVVGINTTVAPVATVGSATAAFSFNFSTGGDQVLAYQGDNLSPSFLFAVNNEDAAVWQADATNSNTSAFPSGLVPGLTAVALYEMR